jgi:hypothetical protein
LPHRDATLDQETADLIDYAGPLAHKARADAMESEQVHLFRRNARGRLLDKLEPLGRKVIQQKCNASGVAARSGETRDESQSHRVPARGSNTRDPTRARAGGHPAGEGPDERGSTGMRTHYDSVHADPTATPTVGP